MKDCNSSPVTISNVTIDMGSTDDARYRAIAAIAKALEVLARQVNSKIVHNNTGIKIDRR